MDLADYQSLIYLQYVLRKLTTKLEIAIIA